MAFTNDNSRNREPVVEHAGHARSSGVGPGKQTLTEQLPVQREAAAVPAGGQPAGVHEIAEHGLQGGAQPLPHLGRIQQLFGRHDVSGVRAFVGGPAAEASSAMGARAYATGDATAFVAAPDLHTAAHEAAHVVQQRAGVSLAGGVGAEGDAYEQHADAVADMVVQGHSAEALLDRHAGSAPATGANPVASSGSRAVQHLKFKANSPGVNPTPANVTVNISTLPIFKVLDILAKRVTAAVGPSGLPENDIYIFDPGDEAALNQQVTDRFPIEFQAIHTDLGSDGAVRLHRNVQQTTADQRGLLEAIRDNGAILGFETWVAAVFAGNNSEQRQDQINELREAARQIALRGGTLQVSEQSIPGGTGASTADLTPSGNNGQIEVKTVREPITQARDLSDQMRAGAAKFNGATSASNEVTVFASYEATLIPPSEKVVAKPNNIFQIETVDPATNTFTTRVVRRLPGQPDQPLSTRNTCVGDLLIQNPLGQTVPGKDKVLHFNFMMENGQKFRLVRQNPAGTQWLIQNI